MYQTNTYRAKRCIVCTTSSAPSTLLECATRNAQTVVRTASTMPYQTAKSFTSSSMQGRTAAPSPRDMADAARNTRRSFKKALCGTEETAFFRHHQGLLESHFGIGVWPIWTIIRLNRRHTNHTNVHDRARRTAVAYLTLPLSSHTQSQSVHRWNETFSFGNWIRDKSTCGSAIPVSVAAATERQLRTFLRAMRLLRLKQLANPHAAEELDILSYANNLEEWRAAVDATLGEAQARPYISLMRKTDVEPLSGLRTELPARENRVTVVEQHFRL